MPSISSSPQEEVGQSHLSRPPHGNMFVSWPAISWPRRERDLSATSRDVSCCQRARRIVVIAAAPVVRARAHGVEMTRNSQ